MLDSEKASLVAPNLDYVRERVAAASKEAGRSDVTLVAVSKLMELPILMQAYDHGQRHFGENYVQEICDKAPQMPSDVLWHFIGHLQSNKAKLLIKHVPNLYVVESLDSAKTASALNKALEGVDRKDRLRVMIQVNTSEEESKSGISSAEASELAHHVMSSCPRLDFCGLMTIGKLGDPNPAPYFEELSRCREDVTHKLSLKDEQVGLSMGMSSDFELAIASGSNNVRVGSTIFGARPARVAVSELRSPEKRAASSTVFDPLAPHPASVPEDTVLKDEGCGHVYRVTWCAECCPPNPHAYTPTASGTPFGPGGSEVRAITVGRTQGSQPVLEDDQEGDGFMGMVAAGVALAVAYVFWKRR